VTSQRRIRLFLDSNVLAGGIVSPWGLDKAALSLCAARLCRLVLAEVVRDEVKENLLLHAERRPSLDGDELIEHYRRLVDLTNRQHQAFYSRGRKTNRTAYRYACRVLPNTVVIAPVGERTSFHSESVTASTGCGSWRMKSSSFRESH
jgi:hypothetical protein